MPKALPISGPQPVFSKTGLRGWIKGSSRANRGLRLAPSPELGSGNHGLGWVGHGLFTGRTGFDYTPYVFHLPGRIYQNRKRFSEMHPSKTKNKVKPGTQKRPLPETRPPLRPPAPFPRHRPPPRSPRVPVSPPGRLPLRPPAPSPHHRPPPSAPQSPRLPSRNAPRNPPPAPSTHTVPSSWSPLYVVLGMHVTRAPRCP